MKCTLSDLFIGNYRISQRFGGRPGYYSKLVKGLKGHDGIDFATPVGTPLIAPFDGIIISTKNSGSKGYGLHVKIWDGKQWCVLYGHLSRLSVRGWQRVKQGQLIGYSGNTGNSTGAHLHVGLCETNRFGYRLNTRNGFFGWLDIMNKNIVQWIIKNPVKALKI